MVAELSSAPPASAALPQKATAARERTTTVAFAQEIDKNAFDIPSVEDVLSREEDAGVFSDFTNSLCASVSQVCTTVRQSYSTDEHMSHMYLHVYASRNFELLHLRT